MFDGSGAERTPDVSLLLKELHGRAGAWIGTSIADVLFVIAPEGPARLARRFWSFDGRQDYAPMLVLHKVPFEHGRSLLSGAAAGASTTR